VNSRLASIPSTNLSLTARSTVFTVSFTASVALFRAKRVVLNALVAEGATKRVDWRGRVRRRKDIFALCFRVQLTTKLERVGWE
jgi:hypothetical protein